MTRVSVNHIAADLPACDWLCAFTATAPPDYKAATLEGEQARRELERELAPLQLTWLSLEHGNRVLIDPAVSGAAPAARADAALITRPAHAVAFTTADCLPVVLVDISQKKVAGIHAGWRGLATGVIEATLACFDDLGKLHAWIGPGIAQADYEVAQETYGALRAVPALREAPASTDRIFTATREDHWLVDLTAIATLILREAGVPTEHITRFEGSTFKDARLHSARRDGAAAGRMATIVGIQAL